MPAASGDRDNGPNTLRVLVATDTHVGYEEKDPVRSDDSCKAFDEILTIAKTQEVDMVLLGGDLFHENKPSRKSMYQVMRSLRKHCLGNKPVQLEFLSDANEVFQGAFSHVNYEDPDMNISLPVFSIHGNHDDPSGEGHYCSLDLLQVAGLVNYFGRVPKVDDIQVKPVLLQKGDTRLALYGISNVRDERLFRTFRDKHVTFYRPPDDEGKFFNLLTVHQNHTAHSTTSYLPESVLPDWMDLVVWGHEHDCQIEPLLNPETGFHVMQPGSSVATSLIAGEADTKHVAIVSITGEEFKSEKIALKTVRPFIHKEIVLKTELNFKKLQFQKNNRETITIQLIDVIEKMIEQANEMWLAKQEDPEDIPEDARPLPLIRLKVDYSAEEGGVFDIENPQRFSNRFVGKVANVNDVVAFHRRKAAMKRNTDDVKLPGAIKDALENEDIIRIDDLVREFLQDSALKVLPQNHFEDAIMAYIHAGDKDTMDTFINESLSKSLKYLASLEGDELLGDLDGNIERAKEALQQRWSKAEAKWSQTRKLKPRPANYDSDKEGPWDNPNHPERWVEINAKAPAAKTKSQARRHAGGDDVDMNDSDMFMANVSDSDPPVRPVRGVAARGGRGGAKNAAPAARKAPATRAPPKKRGGFVVDSDDDDEEEEEEEAQQDDAAMSVDDFLDEEEDEPPAPPPKRGGRAATKPAPAKTKAAPKRASAPRTAAAKPVASRGRQSKLNFSQSQRPTSSRVNATQQTLTISDDEIDDDDDDDDDGFEPVAPARRSRR
ncbi:unnamed protein product [Discula destructiva]